MNVSIPLKNARLDVAPVIPVSHGDVRGLGLSGDGRRVLCSASSPYVSWDEELIPSDPPVDLRGGYYVLDRKNGHFSSVCVDSFGAPMDGEGAVLSADGRFVAFQTSTREEEDPRPPRPWLKNLATGVTVPLWPDSEEGPELRNLCVSRGGKWLSMTVERGSPEVPDQVVCCDTSNQRCHTVSVNRLGLPGNGDSYGSAISDDGRFILFDSSARDLVDDDTNGSCDVFLHDRKTGRNERVSVGADGLQANGNSASACMSADARYVVFYSKAPNLIAKGSEPQLFLRDRVRGTTELISRDETGRPQPFKCGQAVISGDGRRIAYHGGSDMFVYDAGDPNPVKALDESCPCALSHDGSVLLFQSSSAAVSQLNQSFNTDDLYVATFEPHP